ncbi:hypothetical protein [Caulobacter sp. X]|uniref:hypothetical protein n=1 Tax=Caulobacter sp. X TaxID=2048901 RepID=UPI000C157120|nr:hypothetical protein [Caulobacter sp. X]PIC01482.1 hypothetical protein CSW60_08290 [Caulobacter sp. X]
MTEPTPTTYVEIIVGLDGNFNFMNLATNPPSPLSMDLSQRQELYFRLSDELIAANWAFQRRPIHIDDDYGVNFSSWVWVTEGPHGAQMPTHTAFKIIYECNRMGIYTYSLFMLDGHKQLITLDPDVENGTGQIP